MYLLGIDVGSTGIKAVIFNDRGDIIAIGRKGTEVSVQEQPDGAQELFWMPDEMWRNIVCAIQEAVAQIDDPGQIKGLAVTGFGADGVPVDERGTCLYPFISFHDKKTVEQLNHFKKMIKDEDVYNITGIKPWFYHTIFKHLWMKEHEPEIYKNAYKWLIITDYANYKLCGKMAAEYTEASHTLMFDQKKLDWSVELLHKLGLRSDICPTLMRNGTILGEVTDTAAAETGLQAGTPVVLGGLDLLCSSFAAGANSPDSLAAVTGTFESTICSTQNPVITPAGMASNLVCHKSVVADEYALFGAHYAGGILEWFKENFVKKEKNDSASEKAFYAQLDSLQGTPPGANGVFLLPDLLGAMTPDDDPNSRAAFVGITGKASKLDFAKAIIEGVNYQSFAICQALENATQLQIDRIINIGGAGYSEFWMQNKADIFGKIIAVPPIKEATALGAALLAGVGIGEYTSFQEANERTRKECAIYEPDTQKHATYVRYYDEIFTKLYTANKSIHHTISDMFP